jgi:N-acetylglucosamine kinase-like BadF-type ATPase
VRIVRELTLLDESAARELLDRCGGELKTAVIAHAHRVLAEDARRILAANNGHLRSALPADPRPLTPDLVLGIDAGGSSVVAWLGRRLTSGELQIVGKGAGGPANPHSVGWGAAVAEIDLAIAAAFAEANRRRCTVGAMCIAAAGVARRAEQQRLTAYAVRHHWAEAVDVVDDAQPVLAAGTPDDWGIAVIAGTGSIVVGRSPGGKMARAGGWGPLLGDEGSAYSIAVEGLRAAVRAVDGRGPQTRLTDDLLKALKLTSPQQLVATIYDTPLSRSQLARLAPIVTQAAIEADPVAGHIVDHAAVALAEQIGVVAAKLEFNSDRFPLALAGGVLVECDLVRDSLLHHAHRRGIAITAVQTVPEPVAGAVKLASNCNSIRNPQS